MRRQITRAGAPFEMISRYVDLVDHESHLARARRTAARVPAGFCPAGLRGCWAWRSSRARGRLTRPYRLTSASDLTRNSLPRALAGSFLLHIYFRIFLSRTTHTYTRGGYGGRGGRREVVWNKRLYVDRPLLCIIPLA